MKTLDPTFEYDTAFLLNEQFQELNADYLSLCATCPDEMEEAKTPTSVSSVSPAAKKKAKVPAGSIKNYDVFPMPGTPTLWAILAAGGKEYSVDASAGTCTCPKFRFEKHCKHLDRLEKIVLSTMELKNVRANDADFADQRERCLAEAAQIDTAWTATAHLLKAALPSRTLRKAA